MLLHKIIEELELKSINEVISNGYCLGCGLCHAIEKNTEIVERNGNLISNYSKKDRGHIAVCPGAGYDIVDSGKRIHSAKNYSYELGWYNELNLVQSLDTTLLKKASSGGAMTTIALFMLEKGYVDGVICTKYTYDSPTPRPTTYIARNKEELIEGQGSKYCPTSTLSILSQLQAEEKYVLIGTPCQIAGWRKYQKELNPSINIVLTLANFCGGYRDFREIDHFVHNVAKFDSVKHFQHRGDGVPGLMKIVDNNGREWKYPYPKYAQLSPIQKNNRCVYCIDATGELADISCGDAWIKRITDTGEAWSTIILRNKKAQKLFSEMLEAKLFNLGKITENEVVESQRLNITSKKYRQYKRIKIKKILLQRVPDWYDGIKNMGGSYITECEILLSKYIRSKLSILYKR